MGETDEAFVALGEELVQALTEHAGLEQGSRVLDIGCGYGRLPFALTQRGFSGRYVGVDVLKPQLRWCSRWLGGDSFEFRHFDLRNDRYNPNGRLAVKDLDLGGERYDVIAAFSVFTHMWPEDVEAYLRLFARSLATGGSAVATFFLIDDEWRKLASAGNAALTLPHRRGEACRFQSASDPLHRVAYDVDWLEECARAAGLRRVPFCLSDS